MKHLYDGRFGWLNMNLCQFEGPQWFASSRLPGMQVMKPDNDYRSAERAVTADESEVLRRAMLRSSKLIHDGEFVGGAQCTR